MLELPSASGREVHELDVLLLDVLLLEVLDLRVDRSAASRNGTAWRRRQAEKWGPPIPLNRFQ
jgi:hypothetical protein